jgi:hypothetical protein
MSDRRDYVINEAVRAGKFSPQRARHWRRQYDEDPAGTEATIAVLSPALDGPQPYPRDLFPELAKEGRGSFRALRSAPATTAAAPVVPSPTFGNGRTERSATAPPSARRSGVRPPTADAGKPSVEDVATWSSALGFQSRETSGRVTRAGD